MPIFEYRCSACSHIFESLQRSAAAPAPACPECGGADVGRMISAFAVGRNLTPCGTPSSDAAGCGINSRNGGCGGCCGLQD